MKTCGEWVKLDDQELTAIVYCLQHIDKSDGYETKIAEKLKRVQNLRVDLSMAKEKVESVEKQLGEP